MLKPDERAPLLELLRPPLGYQLDQAVGTSFSLDLLAAITVPLAFALFDWENKEGKIGADPLALLEALRRYGDRLTIFSHAGQIQLPTKYPPLVPWLEESIFGVVPKDPKGVFHPKVWALRFTKPNATREDKVLYRVLCMSRNLTFDRSWDTVVALDGELTDRELAFADNRPLSEFFVELPRLKSQRALSSARRAAIAKIADELLRVKFDLPDGFESCRFWAAGLGGLSASKCFDGARQALIVSPFVSAPIVQALTDDDIPVYLVSRTEELQKLNPATLRGCQKVYTLSADAVPENPDEQEETTPSDSLDGLHAKLFVTDNGWNASVFTGSFNATTKAFNGNVEFMVELTGKRKHFGVNALLAQETKETKFADLLCAYHHDETRIAADPLEELLDDLLTSYRRSLVEKAPSLEVTAITAEDFVLTLRFPKGIDTVEGVSARCRPITLPVSAQKPLDALVAFAALGYPQLTPFLAIELIACIEGKVRSESFVLNLPLINAPQDRLQRALAAALGSQDQLLRYILFMLAAGSDDGSVDTASLRAMAADAGAASSSAPLPCMFETLLRALHHDPAQLDRVHALLHDLGQAPGGTALLSPEFQAVWNPLWAARNRGVPA